MVGCRCTSLEVRGWRVEWHLLWREEFRSYHETHFIYPPVLRGCDSSDRGVASLDLGIRVWLHLVILLLVFMGGRWGGGGEGRGGTHTLLQTSITVEVTMRHCTLCTIPNSGKFIHLARWCLYSQYMELHVAD